MPHVVLTGNVSVENIFDRLNSLFIGNGSIILRTSDAYLERGKNAILIESLAIEDGAKRSFLVVISGRENGVVVRLYPKFEVEKNSWSKKSTG